MDAHVQNFLIKAMAAGVPLNVEDIGLDDYDEYTIDDMPAEQWFDAMTMD